MGLRLICRSIYFNRNVCVCVCVCVCVVFCVHKPWRWMGKQLIAGESKPCSPGCMAADRRASMERACKYIYHLDLEASRASCWPECPGPQTTGGQSILCPGDPGVVNSGIGEMTSGPWWVHMRRNSRLGCRCQESGCQWGCETSQGAQETEP